MYYTKANLKHSGHLGVKNKSRNNKYLNSHCKHRANVKAQILQKNNLEINLSSAFCSKCVGSSL